MDTKTNCDPRIRMAEKLLEVLDEAEEAFGFSESVVIHSEKLAAVLMLLGGKTEQDARGFAQVKASHDGITLIAKVPPTDKYGSELVRTYEHGFKIAGMLSRLIDEVLAAHKSTAQDAWVRVYETKSEIVEASHQ
jgi:hypothetical protein